MNYEKKYLKYKSKYLKYKTQLGGYNRFTLIIKRRYPQAEYWYNYYIVDNLKPSNIYTFEIESGDGTVSAGKSFFVDKRDNINCDNIVAYYFDQTMLKTSDGGYVGLNWPKKLSEPIFRGTQDDENNKYRIDNINKFGEKIYEINMLRMKKKILLPIEPNELSRLNFD